MSSFPTFQAMVSAHGATVKEFSYCPIDALYSAKIDGRLYSFAFNADEAVAAMLANGAEGAVTDHFTEIGGVLFLTEDLVPTDDGWRLPLFMTYTDEDGGRWSSETASERATSDRRDFAEMVAHEQWRTSRV